MKWRVRIKQAALWLIWLPAQAAILLLLAVAEILRFFLLLVRRWRGKGSSAIGGARLPDRTVCSIVILNWNGRDLLERSLPAVLEAVRRDGAPHQVLVVDNGSTDGSREWLTEQYPEVELLALDRNLGFVEGNNRGVTAARHEIVVLLNNDMIPDPDFLRPLLAGFNRAEVFAVAAQVTFPPGKRREETGQTLGTFRRGYLHLAHGEIRRRHYRRGYLPVLWAGGGASAFRRDRFLALGGFSSLYEPCYFEDTDLSYRAWRRGWHCLVAAHSRVLHLHRSSTSRRFSPRELEAVMEERRLWYLWSNLQLRSLLSHFLWYPLNFYEYCRPTHWLRALRRLPLVLVHRLSAPPRAFSDRDLLAWSRRPWPYLQRFRIHPPSSAREARERPLRILVLSAYLPHLGTHGGAGRVMEFLRQTARRHRVTLVTFVEGDQDRGFVEQPQAVCHRLATVLRREYEPLSCFPYEPFEEFNSPKFREVLEDVLCEEDFDLVQFEWTQMALYAPLVSHLPKILTEVEVNWAGQRTLLNVERRWWRRPRLYYNMLQTLYREVELCRRVDRVICVTPEDAHYLEGYLDPRCLRVLPTGVDVNRFHFQPDGFEPNTIAFIGAFRHYPNVDAMCFFARDVFPRIRREEPSARLYVVGASPPDEIKRLGEQPGVVVTGYVENLWDYYRRAQVVVVPLRTGVGIRGKVLEGWSVGKAMVATPLACQGLPAVHGENILLASEPEDFVRWVLALFRHPDFCVSLGTAGRKVVETSYAWPILGERLDAVYREVLAEGRPGEECASKEHQVEGRLHERSQPV